jgi:RimJ/RimL family protein N-acetyltransferase
VSAEPAAALETRRLVLSRIARDDVDELVDMLLNPALYGFIGDAPADAAAARIRAERWLRGSVDPGMVWINYVARRRDGARLIGFAQATVHRAGDRFGECEIAYLVDPSAQGHGFATEMMRAFCAELLGSIDPAELTAHIHPGHEASEGVAKAVGLALTTGEVDGERVWRAVAPRKR